MIVNLNIDLILSETLTSEQRASATMHAGDTETLGIDSYLVDGLDNAPFPAVLAHLLMFDPAWLFSQPWMSGWIVTETEDADR